MSVNQYYIMIRGEWRGPVDVEEIERLFDAGEIGTRTLYSKEGWSQGREVGEILASRGRRDQAVPLPVKPIDQKKSTSPVAILLVVVLCGIALLCMIGGIAGSGGGSSESSKDSDAHYTAEQFIMKQYPGAKSVSSLRDSIVQHDGDTYMVAVTVDGLNAFGGPVRKQVGVEMRLEGDTWKLVQIKQR